MKRLLLLATFILSVVAGKAQGMPTVSTDGNEVWYLIQFMNGGNALTAASNNAQITTASAIASDEQLWKITGNSTSGYTFTNKKGYTLYVPSANKNQMVSAAASPSGVSKFYINATGNSNYAGGFEIQPAGNTSISMNLWGGPAENRGVGLWDKNDQNNPVQFNEASKFETEAKISIIPYPAQLEVGEGEIALQSLNAITYPNTDVQGYVTDFANMVKQTAGVELQVKESAEAATNGEIWLCNDEALPAESYTLEVKENGIEIKASGKAGFFYAIQTLKQLLPRELFGKELCSNVEWNIPLLSITDKPQYEYRGFMMDVARHFFDKEEVLRVLDIMSLYKLNRLHWHLTDDQGWRIEIPEYPLLTEVGAVRSGSFTSPGDGSKFFDDTEYGRGMFFTQEQLREIVAYAAERNIEILPEIDLPGHMVAAVTSYPELSCDPTKEYSVRIDGGISQDVLNIGKDETIEFLKCVLDNVAEIFPYPYIHIGGDECPTGQWQNNEDCLRRVREEGLAGVHELQSWLVEELGIYLKEKHNKDLVVWDELLAHWTSKNTVKPVIMAWNSIGHSSQAADKGFKSILAPYSHVYIDFMQVPADRCTVDEPYYGGWGDSHVNTVEEAYTLNPVSSLSGREEFCMGVQANLWAETLNDNIELEYQLLPRIIALSETGWLPNAKKSWASFYRRLQSHDEILDLLGYTYAKHYIEPKELTAEEQVTQEATEILAASKRGAVGYPEAAIHDALQAAVESGNISDIQQAVTNYKNAAIVQPEEGKTYQIVSASIYYKRQYAGSTMYANGNDVRFHYTPQVEPEELWQFEATGDGYVMKNMLDGRKLSMPTYNAGVVMGDESTTVRIDKATIATREYTFIPGVVTISATEGYSASASGSVKRLHCETSGYVNAYNNPALCYSGTWYIVEVSDFTAQLKGLCKKCELIILRATPGEIGQPTSEAIEFLQNSVITPAQAVVEKGNVSEETYNIYVALYHQFLMMPRASVADAIDTSKYYYIRNAYFTTNYAALNSSNNQVDSRTKGTGDNFLWSFVKNNDGTVYIYNKANGKAAYISNDADEQKVMVGREYAWTLEETTADTGNSGIAIVSKNGSSAWYTNPSAWNYVLTKPSSWGASVWTLEKTDIEVETSIEEVTDEETNNAVYDLMGRKVSNPVKGIYIVNDKKVIIK